jgi:hypothetical protein
VEGGEAPTQYNKKKKKKLLILSRRLVGGGGGFSSVRACLWFCKQLFKEK